MFWLFTIPIWFIYNLAGGGTPTAKLNASSVDDGYLYYDCIYGGTTQYTTAAYLIILGCGVAVILLAAILLTTGRNMDSPPRERESLLYLVKYLSANGFPI